MPRRSFAQYHHQHERESKPMISTESASPAKRLSSGDRERSLKLSLEASELRYRRLFETAQDGILILDANTGKIIDVNPFLLDLLDYPFENMIGQRLWEIGQFKDIAANQAAFETLQRNEYIRYENLPLLTCFATERKVFVANVLIPLQGFESGLIRCDVFELTDLPESPADHVFEWIVEQIEQKGIYIDYLAGIRVKYQNAVLRSFKQPPIAKL